MPVLDRVLSRVNRFLSSSTLDGRSRVSSPEIEAQILVAQERAWHEIMPVAAVANIIAGLAVYIVLSPRVDAHDLAWWLVLRCLASAARWAHAVLSLRGVIASGPGCRRGYVALSWLDGIIWSALGWYFTPLFSLDVAVVTISTLIGVSCISASMLHMSQAGTAAYVLPVLVPNAFYAMGRYDDLGYFCLGSVLGVALLLMMEAKRANLRIGEMLRLRFESELANKAKSEALEQARLLAETKSRFVATMSHEMRTPLHGILGLLRQMQREARAPDDSRRLTLLNSSGEHLLNVINDVLDFSKIEAGGLPIHAEVFDLHALVMELAETSHVTCVDKGLQLDLQLALPAGEHVHGDPTRLRQILHNLLGNAIKFTPQGVVGLHVWRDAGSQSVRFEVTDTGVGIAAHELPLVFQAFHQAEGTYKRRFGGTGLGLTISKDLTRAMGGELWCRSEVGQGSVFGFDLPLQAMPAPTHALHAVDLMVDNGTLVQTAHAETAMADSATGAEPAPHVLLVEDNPVNAMVAEAELMRLGVQVTVVDNGHKALDWLAQQEPDLVLMDCEMPVMDGIETTRRIRERERMQGRNAGLRIVALTANGPEVYAERCRPVGMNDHLTKPFRTEDLARVLARHLRVKPRLCFS